MAKRAILLANLGSPDSYEVADVRRYLNEFLMDERVIDLPSWLRGTLVKGLISPLRAPSSAAKYKTIWTDDGSPLIHISEQLTRLVAERSNMPTELCMRYGNPTPQSALQKLHEQNPDLEMVIMLPLYPHYAMSSYETAVLHVEEAHKNGGYSSQLKVVQPYYKDTRYIEALAASMKPYLDKPRDFLLFSYHGIPERHLRKTDCTGKHCMKVENCCQVSSPAHAVCYRHQVFETTEAVAKVLGLEPGSYGVSFQSRLGPDPWLTPSTAKELKAMPARGIKNLTVVCPAFVSDCLETLEEIREEGAEDFEAAGGHSFTAIPCMNTHPEWIDTVLYLVQNCIDSNAPRVVSRSA